MLRLEQHKLLHRRRARRLRELSFGSLEGRRWDDLDQADKDALARFEGFAAPGGESLEALRRRVHEFLGELVPGPHLVFTHGGVIRLLCHDAGVTRFVRPASLTVLDWSARTLLE